VLQYFIIHIDVNVSQAAVYASSFFNFVNFLFCRISTTLKKESPGQILLPGISVTFGRKYLKPSGFVNCPHMCRYVRFYICMHI